jgi:hypothetical protein
LEKSNPVENSIYRDAVSFSDLSIADNCIRKTLVKYFHSGYLRLHNGQDHLASDSSETPSRPE